MAKNTELLDTASDSLAFVVGMSIGMAINVTRWMLTTWLGLFFLQYFHVIKGIL